MFPQPKILNLNNYEQKTALYLYINCCQLLIKKAKKDSHPQYLSSPWFYGGKDASTPKLYG